METKLDAFNRERDRLNKILSRHANRNMKNFMDLDWRTYSGGAVPEKYKELMGLVASLVLRCDDCIRYHVSQSIRLGVSEEEFEESMMIGLIVGGSITIPHIRRAVEIWDVESNPKSKVFRELDSEVDKIIGSSKQVNEKLQEICDLMVGKVSHYHWFGFYMTDPLEDKMLVLGPYTGEPTDHKRIPFGKGICGQAAQTGQTFLIDDVTKENNYLSCSISVKSEIVVPIIRDGKILGELDIDSHNPGAFDDVDKTFLESICVRLAKIL
jgi:AhpD family alkylhydroperoxidase